MLTPEQITALKNHLKEIEWILLDSYGEYHICPACENPEHVGHKDDCWLDAFLNGGKYDEEVVNE